jgi:hypothetical protein
LAVGGAPSTAGVRKLMTISIPHGFMVVAPDSLRHCRLSLRERTLFRGAKGDS